MTTNKIVLTVDSQYVDWGIDQGIREIMQNGIDADAKGHPMTATYDAKAQTLTVRNDGISIPKSSLLIGYSTKKGDNTQIGEFGEGYKLGCMALVKRGLAVRILTAGECWTPILEHSEAFQRDVLAFEIEPSSASEGTAVEFAVSGLTPEMWEQARKQFIMFDDKRRYTALPYADGEVLTGPAYKGKIYINGILIQHITEESYEFGYNFKPGIVAVDRDRRMADRYALKGATSSAVIALATQNEEFFPKFEELLKDGAADIQNVYDIPGHLKRRLRDSFLERFGNEAIPVKYDNEITEAGHYGKRGKVFSGAYVSALSDFADLELSSIRRSFGTKIQHVFDTLELTAKEGRNLLRSKQLLAVAVPSMPRIDVAKFVKGSNVRGLFHGDSDHVTLNRAILKDYGQTLAVLIHEIAHREGGDGTKEHQEEMTRLWIAVATGPRRVKAKKLGE